MSRTGAASTLITVVVVDDHPFYRDGITRGLVRSGRMTVVGEAECGRAALELTARKRPDVAVLDYQMPDLNGIVVLHSIIRDGLPPRVLLLSAVTDPAVVFQAVQQGARGYLSKDAKRSEIVEAVARVAGGHTVLPPELAAGLAEQVRLRRTTDAPALGERQRQVLDGFARGRSIPQLAAELYLAASTVKTHTQRLYQKLGVSDRAAAVAEAMRRGLLKWNAVHDRAALTRLTAEPDVRDSLLGHAVRGLRIQHRARAVLVGACCPSRSWWLTEGLCSSDQEWRRRQQRQGDQSWPAAQVRCRLRAADNRVVCASGRVQMY